MTIEEFEALYREVAPGLFRYVRRRSDADPEDVVAEVFTTAWRRRSDLPDPELRRAWLYGAARRLLLADGRRRRAESELTRQLAALDPGVSGTGDVDRQHVVAAALSRLGPSDRELVLLVEWERLTPTEVAVVLGERPGTVRVRLHRARRVLAADPELRDLVEHRDVPRVAQQPT